MEEKSTRRKRFEKVAGNRVKNILKTLDNLEKCSNKNNYEYSDKDVKKMEKALKDKLSSVLNSFSNELGKGSSSEFSF
jgi:adenylyl- and sulfurtransferase ThiI